MGKIAKAKEKARKKVRAKLGKKMKDRMKDMKPLLPILGILSLLFSGCATTGEQPARSQTQSNEFRDCVIIVRAEAGEICTQTQANEGSETISQDAAPTNTTETEARLQASPPRRNGIVGAVEALTTPSSGDCPDGNCTDE